MKIKTPTQFEGFMDGILAIHKAEKGKTLGELLSKKHYGNSTIGTEKFYAAKAAQSNLSAIVRIEKDTSISATSLISMDGKLFEIQRVQHMGDTNPPITLLTLDEIRLGRRQQYE